VVGGIGHTTVIGDDLGQLVAECSCGGKVDGIQASQVDLVQRGGLVEQHVVETHQRDPLQQLPRPGGRALTMGTNRADHLRAGKSTRHAVRMSAQVT